MSWRRSLWLSLFLGFLVGLWGCYLTNGNSSGQHHGGGTTPFDGGGALMPGDLPCDVANALVICQACHGATPIGNAPISLATRADLMAMSALYPNQTEAQRAVARMSGTPTQMPPLPSAASPQADIDAIGAWITEGYPTGTCSTNPTVCTSGLAATGHAGSQMRPGEACISCHQNGEGPIETFMGTVYPTLHEPNDCVGASATTYAGVQVVVTDSQGSSLSMTPNSSGNFTGSPGSFAMPFTAKVTYQGREIAMITPQTNGDCNACHTETGSSGAPGRIKLP